MKTIQFLCLVVLLAMFSCKNQQPVSDKATDTKDEVVTEVETEVKEPTAASGCMAILEAEMPESSPVMAFKPGIKDGCLIVNVTYSGGCKDHEMRLYWNGAWAESIPPQTHLYLYHDNKGDNCRELKMEKFAFDLKDMKYPGLNEVQLTVHSGELEPAVVSYRYK